MLALFYPFTIVTIAAGFVALVMILLKFDMLAVSAVVLWFYFACAASIYLISKKALEMFGVRRLFLSFTIAMGIFAILSAALFILRQFGIS